MEYNFREIEKKWQARWAREKTFQADNQSAKPKYYVLDMFPYPSGAGLHVGHPLGYIASDIMARYKRHKGFNVLHPMGYDSFGLPAEQYAIQTGQHPAVTTEQNINRYREQLDKIGFSFDWDREVRTSDPDYYKWTQWIFIQLFNSWYNNDTDRAEDIKGLIKRFETEGNAKVHACCDDTVAIFTADDWESYSEKQRSDVLMAYRIAYLGEAYVNWCPALGTVLANDEVKDGVSERGGHPVERKLMKQWSMRITAYAQRLLDGLDTVDWTESLKDSQRNWIGRSEGASLEFKLQGTDQKITVFTTRPDTVFGVSFVTLAPEHELVARITTSAQKAAVDDYVIKAKNRSERERQADVNTISGVFTGAYVEHPFTGKPVPVWIGDYVLAGYGTGAVMAVPAHDERDYKFANHFGMPLPQVIEPNKEHDFSKDAWGEKEGKLINSDFLNGLEVKAAIKKAIAEIEAKGLGQGKVNFRLRDAVFGRQRYWGEPIPVYYKDGIPQALPENELPLVLPEVDKFLPTEDGEPPLARAKDWKYKPLSISPRRGEDAPNPQWQTAAASGWNTLKERSKALRNNQTDAEYALWQHIRNKQLGYKFRRQQVIGFNIADFVCLDKKLIIEVDGKIHLSRKEYDDARTLELGNAGYRVIRFTNEQVFSDIEHVIREIKAALEVLPEGEDLEGAFYPIETTTMPGWAGSSWYFLRYMDPHNDKAFADKKLIDYWQNVDLYIGGAEHATGHLLYVRFWTKFLKDRGYIGVDEPAKKLINQGMIQGTSSMVLRVNNTKKIVSAGLKNKYDTTPIHVDVNFVDNNVVDLAQLKVWRDDFASAEYELENGELICVSAVEKMSKSKYNVVTPDLICDRFGADTLRLYEMFLGPLEQSKPWNTNGITGVSGFLKKLWRLFYVDGKLTVSDAEPTKAELKSLHKTIKKITEDIERFSFNTSVSNFMICVNELTELKCNKRAVLEPLLVLVSPYAPHIAEELWEQLGHSESISFAPFPQFDEAHLVEDSFSYPVSFNGKMRFNLELASNLTPAEIEKLVMEAEQTHKYLEGKQPKKVIVVPKKIVNIVV